jgi:hypothetical protein
MVKDKRMPLMNEIVDVLEAVTENVEEWVVCVYIYEWVHVSSSSYGVSWCLVVCVYIYEWVVCV